MERGLVAGTANSFEQVEIKFRAGNRTRDVRRVLINASTMWRYHGDGRTCIQTYMDSVVGALDLGLSQIFITFVALRRAGSCHSAAG